MKKSEFEHDIRGTTSYIKRITRGKKGGGELSSKYNLFSDIWFSGVKNMRR